MKWTLPVLTLVMLGLSGCNAAPLCILPEPLCQVTTPPPVEITQYFGVWINEDPQPQQLTRIEIYENAAGWTAMRVWEACSPNDCAFEEGSAIGYVWDGRKALEAYNSRENEGQWRVVHVSLDEPVNNRIRAKVAFLEGDVRPPPEVYYFVKQL